MLVRLESVFPTGEMPSVMIGGVSPVKGISGSKRKCVKIEVYECVIMTGLNIIMDSQIIHYDWVKRIYYFNVICSRQVKFTQPPQILLATLTAYANF